MRLEANHALIMEPHLNVVDSRRDLLLSGIPRDARFVEVGASFRPLVPKRDGWRTCIVDHDTREALAAKYAKSGADISLLEEVDIVWKAGPLHEAFPPEILGSFDALIASHVLEHLPDLVSFLESARLLVKPDGTLVFALPDHRWCFDFFRPPTLAGEVLLANREKRIRHSAATLFNEIAYSVTHDGKIGWGAGETVGELSFFHEFDKAKQVFDIVCSGDSNYRDAHAWQFTPSSFELLILDLSLAGVCDWHVEWIRPADAVEFLGHLRPGIPQFASAAEIQHRRKQLMLAMAAETATQIATILDTHASSTL